MKLKLVINGEDRRVRIHPDNQFDKDLLTLLSDMGGATLSARKKNEYAYAIAEVEYIDLCLEEEDKSVKMPFDREGLIIALKKNREIQGIGSGEKYWSSVADVVEKYL